MRIPYDFKLDYLLRLIEEGGYKKILIQLPNGLKKYYNHIIDFLNEKKPEVEIYVSLSPTYGACDIAEEHARRIGADLIVHVGHNMYPWYKPRVNTVFIEAKYIYDLEEKLLNELATQLNRRKCRNIGLLAVIQHSHNLSRLREFLLSKKFKSIIGIPKYSVMVEGQVLGCEYSAATGIARDVDCFVIISGGMFHALGVFLATRKPVLKIDPYEGRVLDITEEGHRLLMKRYGVIMKALDMRFLGIINGGKPGQNRPWLVDIIAKKAKNRGVRTRLFIADELNENVLRNIDVPEIDAYTVVSCPRLPIDDLYDYEKPVLTPGETIMVLEQNLSHYIFPW